MWFHKAGDLHSFSLRIMLECLKQQGSRIILRVTIPKIQIFSFQNFKKQNSNTVLWWLGLGCQLRTFLIFDLLSNLEPAKKANIICSFIAKIILLLFKLLCFLHIPADVGRLVIQNFFKFFIFFLESTIHTISKKHFKIGIILNNVGRSAITSIMILHVSTLVAQIFLSKRYFI